MMLDPFNLLHLSHDLGGDTFLQLSDSLFLLAQSENNMVKLKLHHKTLLLIAVFCIWPSFSFKCEGNERHLSVDYCTYITSGLYVKLDNIRQCFMLF